MCQSSSLFKLSVGICMVALIAACGGGGGSGNDGYQETTSNSTSSGVITGFSSVYVNGTRYEVDQGTTVKVDGDDRLGDDSALRLGMKVEIEAEEESGRKVARSIDYRRDLRGPVTEVIGNVDNPSTGIFYLVRTPVIVDENTVFAADIGENDGIAGIDLRDLNIGSGAPMVVAVSGFVTGDGYLASRVSRINTSADEIEIKGYVSAVDSINSTFSVSGTWFHVTSATEFEDGLIFNDALIGRFVEVEGRQISTGYEALEVEPEDDQRVARNGQYFIEGVLLSVDISGSVHQIQIDGRTLMVADATFLKDQVGTKVRLSGTINSSGIFSISHSRINQGSDFRIEDQIVSIDLAAGSFVTRLGITIAPDGSSRLEDDDDDDDRLTPPQFLDRLRPNDQIKAYGVEQSDGSVRWTRVVRDDDDDDEECSIRGLVSAIDPVDWSMTVAGITIATGTDTEFENRSGVDISRSAFFDLIRVGDLIDAESDDNDRSACRSGYLLAEDIEIKRTDRPVFPTPDPIEGETGSGESATGKTLFLVIDEDSIDNGNLPNNFSDTEVNDNLAEIGLRLPLRWFSDNVGREIDLFTGQIGDEGWFALKSIPASWQTVGPTNNGLRNYVLAGPGLGGEPDRERFLDEIPDVTPLRATGLAMLAGQTICALVYDSDVSINYSPLTGSLKGDNLGLVAFDVLQATERNNGSSSDLPRMTIRVLDTAVCDGDLYLFRNAPRPWSSSEPFDITPPADLAEPQVSPAP